MKVKNLFDIGFKEKIGVFAISKWIYKDDFNDVGVVISYRPGKGILVDGEENINFDKFSITIYGASSGNTSPLKFSSIEDIKNFETYFKNNT